MAYGRISARRGAAVTLPVKFFKGGVLADPFALYRVEIYRGKVATENIVDIIQMLDPADSSYPAPVTHGDGTSDPAGIFSLDWDVPADAVVPDVYFDVWYFFSTDPRTETTGGSFDELSEHEDKLISVCNRFWVYPDDWYADGGLETIRFAFEPLDQKFNKPENRALEVGLMPLPLYDYNFNLVAPIIPYLDAKISIKTENDETVVDGAAMTIKLRQGSYRTNPFVLNYILDTSNFYIGTYKYRILITLPDGTTRVSGNFYFTIG